jgi:hypothetical protein
LNLNQTFSDFFLSLLEKFVKKKYKTRYKNPFLKKRTPNSKNQPKNLELWILKVNSLLQKNLLFRILFKKI